MDTHTLQVVALLSFCGIVVISDVLKHRRVTPKPAKAPKLAEPKPKFNKEAQVRVMADELVKEVEECISNKDLEAELDRRFRAISQR